MFIRPGDYHRFALIVRKHGATASEATLEEAFSKIERCYSEPHRGHHVNRHISEFHNLLEEYGALLCDPEAMHIGVEGHDLVYRSPSAANRRPENERESMAEFSELLLKLGVTQSFVSRVLRFIETTIFGVERVSSDEQFFHDCDYWILGSTFERYEEYVRGIRKEYRGDEFPEAYRAGRRLFLSGLLERKRVFDTEQFHLRYNDAAVRNAEAELAALNTEER